MYFAAKSVRYLGYIIIKENAVLPAQENLNFIQKLELPTDKTGVRIVLSAINF